jgi:hypothetical protein
MKITDKPMLEAVIPFPSPLTTPPDTNTYFIIENFEYNLKKNQIVAKKTILVSSLTQCGGLF